MKDGGSAFPKIGAVLNVDNPQFNFERWNRPGMSLRDWFAGQFAGTLTKAMTIQIQSGNFTEPQYEHELAQLIARAAYEVADAMLAEREKGAK